MSFSVSYEFAAYLNSYMKLRDGIQAGVSRQGHAAAVEFAVQLAASFRRLIGLDVIFSQRLGPDRHDVAVAGAADRVFSDVELRREAAAHAVVVPPFGRNVQQQSVERCHGLHIGLRLPHVVFCRQDADQVPSHIRRRRPRADDRRHGVRHGDFLHLVSRKVHGQPFAVP